MKIGWMSNAPWAGTGYGQQTDLVTRSLVADGHDVALFVNYGLAGSQLDWEGMKVYPPAYDIWGNDVIKGHALHHFREDRGWVITLFDVWVAQGPAWRELDVAAWVPIDHLPVPPKVLSFFEDSHAVPIAMSRFGERQLNNADIECLYAPHGVDSKVFKPGIDQVNGLKPRDLFALDDSVFVVGMNAANKGNHKIRKGFPQAMAAFGIFARNHDDARLVMHTERLGMCEGVNLERLGEACGIPEGRVSFTDQYAYRVGLPAPMIAAMYNAFDVFLAPSMGEGFGIPVIEAQACGVPVIVSDFSAQPELVGSGWTVGGQPDWDEAQGAWMHLPSVGEIVDALEEAYEGKGDPQAARDKALEYDHDLVYDKYWRPIVAELEQRLTLPEVEAAPVNLDAL